MKSTAKRAVSMIAGMALGVMSGPAFAGWHYAQWGMTPEEVVQASGGEAHLEPSSPDVNTPTGERKVIGYWSFDDASVGDITFPVSFYFGANGLNQVSLYRPANPLFRCRTMYDFAVKKYGNPNQQYVEFRIFAHAKWRIPAEDNFVHVTVGKDNGKPYDCSMVYRPIDSQ